MNDETGGALPDRSKRIYVLWAAGFAFLGLLAIFCVYFLRPCLEVRAAVRRINERKINYEGAVKALGGPEQAAAKCTLYVRLPEKLAARENKDQAFEILGACGQPAFPWLVSLLGSRDAHVRRRTADVLGYLGDSRAVEPLIVALKDSHWVVRNNAAGALGELEDPRAVEPLIAALQDSDAGVRRKAARALGELEDRRAVEPLLAALKDSDAWVRYCAALALGELKDPRAVEPLKALLADPDNEVRKAAEEAIKKIEAPAP
jgi:HEAT repeat protein